MHKRQCASDGCTLFLSRLDPHDICPTCRGVDRNAPPAPRPGTRQVRVTYPTGNSGAAGEAHVTLPAAPSEIAS